MLTKWAWPVPAAWSAGLTKPLMSCRTPAFLPCLPSSVWRDSLYNFGVCVYGWVSSPIWSEMKAAVAMGIGQTSLISTPRLQASLRLLVLPLIFVQEIC